MLGNHPVDVMLLATDLGVARRFYEATLGLELLVADAQFLTFGCGGDSRLVVTSSTTGTADQATKASWRVDDLAGEVAELRGASTWPRPLGRSPSPVTITEHHEHPQRPRHGRRQRRLERSRTRR